MLTDDNGAAYWFVDFRTKLVNFQACYEGMVMRIQHVEGEYRIVVPIEAMEGLKLKPAAPVEVVAVAEPKQAEHRYMTVEEGLAAFRKTEAAHRNRYRELAT